MKMSTLTRCFLRQNQNRNQTLMLFFVEVEMLVGAEWLHTRSLNLGNANIERIRRQRRAVQNSSVISAT